MSFADADFTSPTSPLPKDPNSSAQLQQGTERGQRQPGLQPIDELCVDTLPQLPAEERSELQEHQVVFEELDVQALIAEEERQMWQRCAGSAEELEGIVTTMLSMVHSSAQTLAKVEQDFENAQGAQSEAFNELAEAKKRQARGWKLKSALMGGGVGCAIGTIGGPPGMALGTFLGSTISGGAAKVVEKAAVHRIDRAVRTVRRGEEEYKSCIQVVAWQHETFRTLQQCWEFTGWLDVDGEPMREDDACLPMVHVGAGWEWVGAWQQRIVRDIRADPDGWEYKGLVSRSWGVKSLTSSQRRCCWVRHKRKLLPDESPELHRAGDWRAQAASFDEPREPTASHEAPNMALSEADAAMAEASGSEVPELQEKVLRSLCAAAEASNAVMEQLHQDRQTLGGSAAILNLNKIIQAESGKILKVWALNPLGGWRSGLSSSKFLQQMTAIAQPPSEATVVAGGILEEIAEIVSSIQTMQHAIANELVQQNECLDAMAMEAANSVCRIKELEARIRSECA